VNVNRVADAQRPAVNISRTRHVKRMTTFRSENVSGYSYPANSSGYTAVRSAGSCAIGQADSCPVVLLVVTKWDHYIFFTHGPLYYNQRPQKYHLSVFLTTNALDLPYCASVRERIMHRSRT